MLHARLAGMQSHPHTDLDAGRPPLTGQAELPADRRGNCIARAPKREKQRVALGYPNSWPRWRSNAARIIALMLREHVPIAASQPLEQARRALDIREHEGHGSTRKLDR